MLKNQFHQNFFRKIVSLIIHRKDKKNESQKYKKIPIKNILTKNYPKDPINEARGKDNKKRK